MNTEIIIAICTVITTLLSIKFWLLSPIDKSLEEIKKDIRSIDGRVSFLEGYLLGKDFKNGVHNK